MLSIMFFIYWWCPTKVTRNNDTIVISFKGAGDQVIPVHNIVEIRCIHSFSCNDSCYMCQQYCCRKCFWGVPTSLMKSLVIITNSCCSNYHLSMSDAVMGEFLRDNQPSQRNAASLELSTGV